MSMRPPGLLRAAENPEVIMMICTAGHVDHGKTRLVKLFTGCATDRLKEEQERGLTIELGFAPCFLGDGLCVGIVDVPGHERFIKNMVAGVSGIALTVLVIAADDGVMPQTVEHLQIMRLLGVRRGMVALTKTDLVPPELVLRRTEEIRHFLEGTFLDNAPICPVSSETGDGLMSFYDTLVQLVRSVAYSRPVGVFRMPVERSFIQKGFGVVVTGIPVSGSIAVGDQVELTPGSLTGRIRNIQCFLRDAPHGAAGQCLALNIPDFGKHPAERGQVLCQPGYLRAAQLFHAQVQTVPGIDPPLRHAEALKFHTGTVETPASVYLLEEKNLERNRAGLVTIVTAHPIAAAVGDRFLLRRPSPAATIAGGEILAVTDGDRRPRKPELLARIGKHPSLTAAGLESPESRLDARIAYHLVTEQPSGSGVPAIARALLQLPDEIESSLARLIQSGGVIAIPGGWFVAAEAYAEGLERLETRLAAAREREGKLSMPIREAVKGMEGSPGLARYMLDDLQRRGSVALRGDKVLLQKADSGLDGDDRRLADALLKMYEEGGFASPRPEELPVLLGMAPDRVERLLGFLCDEGRLVRLNKNVVLCYNRMRQAQDIAVAYLEEHGVLDSADFKHHIGSTRKYALAILDYLDARRITVRHGNNRKLAEKYRERLL
ncbi:MAG TPA: selenocysteine-specific translation elongation factor [Candidatus Hydrogenedentes bacterium]|nr:selenocysteine-specific translation elongation factor [Candidatus Hydrogenedentota bacterium]